MKKRVLSLFIPSLAVVLSFVESSYAQIIITPSGATANSSMSSGRTPDKVYDRSGLTDPGTPGDELDDTHGTTRGDQWMSDMLASPPTWLKLELPSASNIDRVYFWNNIGESANRGVQSCDVSFSTDNGASYGTATNLSFTKAVNPSVSEEVSFDLQAGVTHVKLDNFVTHGDARYIGIAEIRFGGPEPPGQLTWPSWSAASITTNSAQLSGVLEGTNAVVTAYWEEGTVADAESHIGWDGTNGPSAATTGVVSRTASDLTADTEYSYAFYATNNTHGTEAWSGIGTFSTALSGAQAPSFTNSVAQIALVTLGWDDNAVNETGYLLQRSTNSAGGPYTYFDVGDVTSYTDLSVSPGTTYYYGLAATNSSNGSATDFSLCSTNATTQPLTGEVIAEYIFTGDYSSSDENANTTASNIVANGHTPSIAADYYEADCADVGNYFSDSDYLSFTINIGADAVASLNAIEWYYGTQNEYLFKAGVYSSAYQGFSSTNNVIPGTYVATLNNQPFGPYDDFDVATNRKVVDLSGLAGSQDLSGTNVEFRIYIGDSAGTAGRKHRFDNIRVYGEVAVSSGGTVFKFR